MPIFAVIDTETNWFDEVMSVGAVIADDYDFQPIDSRYYIIDPEFRRGGMYSPVLHTNRTPGELVMSRAEMALSMNEWLKEFNADCIFAYNAKFDKNHMTEFSQYSWFDIMRIAAYRQYNDRIPPDAPCCRTGRLKANFGVEPMYRMMSNNYGYYEKHNGWHDAIDELKIMEMLGITVDGYRTAKI